jgi:soluble lytic murein transglycosylase-like protein
MSVSSLRPVRLVAVVTLALGLLLSGTGSGLFTPRADAAVSFPLSYGEKGKKVKWVQKRLHVRPRSGWYGPVTRRAVKRWQRAHHRRPTGRVNRATWRALHKGKGRHVRLRASRSGGSSPGLNWAALARCESGGNPRAVNPAGYYGLYQFDVRTWRSVGGKGYPHRKTRRQQTVRAKKLYQRRGSSPWPHCGPRLYS